MTCTYKNCGNDLAMVDCEHTVNDKDGDKEEKGGGRRVGLLAKVRNVKDIKSKREA